MQKMRPSRLRMQTHPQQSSSSTITTLGGMQFQRSYRYPERWTRIHGSETSEADAAVVGRDGETDEGERKDGADAGTEVNQPNPANRSSYEHQKTALAAVEWGLQHEYQIKELEAKLANDLSNSRAIHNLIVEALANLEGNTQRVSRALTRHIPHIHSELHGALDRLAELEARFPLVREQVRAVQRAYEQGRSKAQTLTADLEWTHAPFTERLHRKLFTRSAPVSTLEAVLTRLAFLVVLILCAWQLAGALDGAYRAYRHRLVWGDKLIS